MCPPSRHCAPCCHDLPLLPMPPVLPVTRVVHPPVQLFLSLFISLVSYHLCFPCRCSRRSRGHPHTVLISPRSLKPRGRSS
ncbi:hypothetical protein M752DRAFT_39342 [Aspergillus phoenicis ATCC 13157]|nr:hypothetical protein M752DRAFT_39342 [Aspergillus phoenicis ATCC 13157]